MAIRKTIYLKEQIRAEAGQAVPAPASRVAAIAVVENPFANAFALDLSALFDVGLQPGEELMP